MSSIFFSDHKSMKLEIKYRNKNGKKTNMWSLNMLLKKHGSVIKSYQRSENPLWKIKMETKLFKVY